MNLEKIKELINQIFPSDLSDKKKIYITASIGWIIFIGYLTWWNGLKSFTLDKGFRWDEWLWFGVIPATAPYIFYFIWKKRD